MKTKKTNIGISKHLSKCARKEKKLTNILKKTFKKLQEFFLVIH